MNWLKQSCFLSFTRKQQFNTYCLETKSMSQIQVENPIMANNITYVYGVEVHILWLSFEVMIISSDKERQGSNKSVKTLIKVPQVIYLFPIVCLFAFSAIVFSYNNELCLHLSFIVSSRSLYCWSVIMFLIFTQLHTKVLLFCLRNHG